MWIENQDNLDKAQSLASQALSHLKLWGAEKLDQALVQPASRAIEHTAKTVKQARAAAIDATSDYIIAPTAKAWNAVAQGVTRKYEGAVAATSRGMENTAKNMNRAAEVAIGTWQVILDVYDSGANPEKYQQVVDIKQKPKTKVANKPNKPVWEKKNAG